MPARIKAAAGRIFTQRQVRADLIAAGHKKQFVAVRLLTGQACKHGGARKRLVHMNRRWRRYKRYQIDGTRHRDDTERTYGGPS
jgi:hypothetical protein